MYHGLDRVRQGLSQYAADTRGGSAAEYALVLALITAGLVLALANIGAVVNSNLNTTSNTVGSA